MGTRAHRVQGFSDPDPIYLNLLDPDPTRTRPIKVFRTRTRTSLINSLWFRDSSRTRNEIF